VGNRKQDNHREEREGLYGQIRRLRKVIKMQQREITRLIKYKEHAGSNENDQGTKTHKPKNPVVTKSGCPECSFDKVKTLTFDTVDGKRIYMMCEECGFRKKIKE